MICPKCKSTNVNIQMVSDTFSKRQHHSLGYWILIGWWLEILLWIFLTLPRLLLFIFLPKNKKTVTIQHKMAICQLCGHSWEIK